MKKYLLASLVAIILTPSIALASWWNPISWFASNEIEKPLIVVSSSTSVFSPQTETTKTISSFSWWNPFSWFKGNATNNDSAKNAPTEQVEQNHPVMIPDNASTTNVEDNGILQKELEKIPTQIKEKSLSEKKPVLAPTNIPLAVVPQNISAPTTIAPVIPSPVSKTTESTSDNGTKTTTINTVQQTSLEIKSVVVTTKRDSVLIQWQTNIPTNSKVFVGSSRIVNSESGLSTKHFATVDKLDSNTTYNYEIEAIADSNDARYQDSFKTDPDSYELTLSVDKNTSLINGSATVMVTPIKNGKTFYIPVEAIPESDSSQVKTLTEWRATNDQRFVYSYIPKAEGAHKLTFRILPWNIEKSVTITAIQPVPLRGTLRQDTITDQAYRTFSLILSNRNPGNPSPIIFESVQASMDKSGLVVVNPSERTGTSFQWNYSQQINIDSEYELRFTIHIPETATGKFYFKLNSIEAVLVTNGANLSVEGDNLYSPIEIDTGR